MDSEPKVARRIARERGLVEGRRVEVNVETLRQTGGGTVGGGDAEDEMTVYMVRTGPDMFLPTEDEAKQRVSALEQAMAEAAAEGLPPEGVEELRTLVLSTHLQALRRALSCDPPADVEPLRVHVPMGARAVRARPRPMDRDKAE